MLDLQISGKIRNKFGKQNKNLRKTGEIPAVLYGYNVENTAVSLNLRDFAKIFKFAGESTIVNLNLKQEDGKITKKPVLVYDADLDPVSGQIRHADLYVVNMAEKITATIPLVFVGESNAVKAFNGILLKNIHEVEVESLPQDLPHEIKVDISVIENLDGHILVKDLNLPGNVKIMSNPEDVVVVVKPPRTEEQLKALEGEVKIDIDAVKVESEEKKKAEAEKKAAEEATK